MIHMLNKCSEDINSLMSASKNCIAVVFFFFFSFLDTLTSEENFENQFDGRYLEKIVIFII